MPAFIEVPTATGPKTILKEAIGYIEWVGDDEDPEDQKAVLHLRVPANGHVTILTTETYDSLTARLES